MRTLMYKIIGFDVAFPHMHKMERITDQHPRGKRKNKHPIGTCTPAPLLKVSAWA